MVVVEVYGDVELRRWGAEIANERTNYHDGRGNSSTDIHISGGSLMSTLVMSVPKRLSLSLPSKWTDTIMTGEHTFTATYRQCRQAYLPEHRPEHATGRA